MKCPRCKKPVEDRFHHCPYCGSALEKKKSGIGAVNIGLMVLAGVQIAAAVTGLILVRNGTVAAYYLRQGNYDKAVSLLEKYEGGKDNSEVMEQMTWNAKKLRADYDAGKLDYSSVQHTIVKLRDAAEPQTAGTLDGILDALESEQAGLQAKKNIMLLVNAGDYEGAIHSIQSMEKSEAWSSYSEDFRTELLKQKTDCADQMIRELVDSGRYFDDGDGRGALHLALDQKEWYPGLFSKADQWVKDALRKLNTREDWLTLVHICNTGFPELQGYQQIEGFSYGDYVGIQMGAATNWASVECSELLDKINEQRAQNGAAPLRMDQDLRRVAGIISGKMLPTDQTVDDAKHTNGLNITKYDCYTYQFNTSMMSDELLQAMIADTPPKRHFSETVPGENLLNADWIDSIGIALSVRQNGKLHWFLIATGDREEK